MRLCSETISVAYTPSSLSASGSDRPAIYGRGACRESCHIWEALVGATCQLQCLRCSSSVDDVDARLEVRAHHAELGVADNLHPEDPDDPDVQTEDPDDPNVQTKDPDDSDNPDVQTKVGSRNAVLTPSRIQV